MTRPIDPSEAAVALSELLRSNPKKATSTIHAVMKDQLVPNEVKAALATTLNDFRTTYWDGGRNKPFEPKKSMDEYMEHYKLDAKDKQVLDQLVEDEVAAGLMERMGTDVDREPDPRTRQDDVRAAFETIVKE